MSSPTTEVKPSQVNQLIAKNEKLTLEFQDYKFEANRKVDRLVVFNQQLGKSCEKLKAENQELKEENEELKEELEVDENGCSRGFNKGYEAAESDGMSEVEQLRSEIEELKEENEKLKERDQQAMELSQKQNDLFMNQLEEKDKEIAAIKEKYEPKPHKYKVGDVIRYTTDYGYVNKFLEITGTTKCMYKVREIENEKRHKNYPERQESEDFYVISKDKQLWRYLDHKNVGKKDMENYNYLLEDCFEEGQNETEWIMSKYHHCS